MIGAGIVGGAVWWATHPSSRAPRSPRPPVAVSHAHHRHRSSPPSRPPRRSSRRHRALVTLPQLGTATGSPTATFLAVTHTRPPVPLQVITVPWSPGTRWAVEPLGIPVPGHPTVGPILWFGVSTHAQHWTWIPSIWPLPLSSQLPAPARSALVMAGSLHAGDPGPSSSAVLGTITWQALQGKVGVPAAWMMAVYPASASPFFAPTVGILVLERSHIPSFTGYYMLESVFDAHNAVTGDHSLLGFTVTTQALSRFVQHPIPLL